MKSQIGFSMIELLIGIIISILVSISLAGTVQFFESNKRSAMALSSAYENTALAIRRITYSTKMMGYVVSSCPTTTFTIDQQTILVDLPLYITSSEVGSDQITIFYGNSVAGSSNAFLRSNFTKSADNIKIQVGYSENINSDQLVLISDNTKCDVYAVKEKSCEPVDALYDSSCDSPNYTISNIVLNADINNRSWSADQDMYKIGDIAIGLTDLKLVTYSVEGGGLNEYDSVTNTSTRVSDDIVYIKAYYGLSDGSFVKADNSSGIDWTYDGLKSSPENYNKIRSIRLLLVAKSSFMDKKNDTGNCDSTTGEIVSWIDGPNIDLNFIPNWRCYKYEVSDFIIPFMNKKVGV